MPFLNGEAQEGPRHEFLYWTDDGDLAALRYNKWKVMFLEPRAQGFDGRSLSFNCACLSCLTCMLNPTRELNMKRLTMRID